MKPRRCKTGLPGKMERPRGANGEHMRAHWSFKPGVTGSSPVGATKDITSSKPIGCEVAWSGARIM